MNCNNCGKWAGAYARAAGQSMDDLCHCQNKSIPTKLFGPNLEEILNSAGFYQKKEWVGLTDAERSELWWGTDMGGMPEHEYGKKVEAKLKEKNT